MKKLKILIVMLAAFMTAQAQNTSPYVITTTGTSSWTCPANATSVTIECWGGGGAGGVATAGTGTTNSAIGKAGGGTGGSYAKKTYSSVALNTVFNYTIGTGGASGGASPTQTIVNTNEIVAVGGTNGTSVTTNSGSNVLGGITAAPSSGNAGDSPFYYGGNGGLGGTGGTGGGGGSAGSGGNGGNGGGTGGGGGSAGSGGNGSIYTGAAGATGIGANGTSPSGTQPGSGGAGGYYKYLTAAGNLPISSNGGAGGAGKIIISWTLSGAPTITFASATITKNYGDAAFTQTASSNSLGAISYSSSNTAVATVNASTAEVTIVGVGSTTITASQAADGAFTTGSATYTVTVNPLTINTGTLNNGALTTESGVASSPADFTVSASGLVADVIVTCSTSFEVSTSIAGTYAATVTLPHSGGDATVYTRLKAGLAPNNAISAANRVVTLNSTGATTKQVQLTSASVSGISNTVAGGNTIGYVYGAGPSTPEKILTLNGQVLTGASEVLVTPGSNMEISSTSGSGFASTAISIPVTANAIPNNSLIYARLKAGVAAGSYADATTKVIASVTGGTFTSKEVAFTGTVTTAPTISFASATVNKTVGDAAFTQTATSNSAGAITYSSGSTGIATVDASTGAVTIVGVGSAAITATQAANGYYTSASTSYTVVVAANVSSAQTISALALPASGSVTVTSTGTLTIDQDASGITINVQPGGKVTLADTKALTSSTLTLQSDATGTGTFMDNNSTPATLSATVQQYLPQGRNWYLSIPVSSGNTSSLIGGTLATSVSYWNEFGDGTTGAWVNSYSGGLTPGLGYVAVSASGTSTNNASFTGTLNSGDVPVTLTRSGTGSYAGFNLVANPYPSYINWQTVNANNAAANMPTGTMWYRTISYNNQNAWAANTAYNVDDVVYNGTRFYKVTTAGTSAATGGPTGTTSNITDNSVVWAYQGSIYIFATVNASGVSTPSTVSNLVPPMQAFWVRTNTGGGTLTFENTMRTHNSGSSNALKAPRNTASNIQLLRLSITNGISTDESVIYSSANASNAFDSYDAPKYFNTAGSNQAEIYTQVGSEKLVINAMNELNQGTEIPLGFATEKLNNFRISASELKNFASDMQIMLIDKQKNTEFNLTNSQAYEFSSDVVNDANRFSIIFRTVGSTTGLKTTEKLYAQVFVNAANQITIIAPSTCNYAIYNAVGQKVNNGFITSNRTTINDKLQSGMYVVRVSENGKELTSRVIIK